MDVNSALEHQLIRLPGVGPALALAMISFRGEKPITKENLEDIPGIGPVTAGALRTSTLAKF